MANRSDRGLGQPDKCPGRNSPQSRMGPDPRKPSRPAIMPTASTGRTQDCTRPKRHTKKYPCNAGAIHTGNHQGQRSCPPHQQAGHKTAPDQSATPKSILATREPSTQDIEAGDVEGRAVWVRIVEAVKVLLRDAPMGEHFKVPSPGTSNADQKIPRGLRPKSREGPRFITADALRKSLTGSEAPT
jgi:hypothetical protein